MDSAQEAPKVSWLRRTWLRLTVPEDVRCSFCPQKMVMTSMPIVDGKATRRCIEHPPPELAGIGTCPVCGRGFWPDFLHLDCGTDGVRR